MPPKKGGGGGGKKDVKKTVADKTFGMKNKKGKKNQEMVKMIAKSVEASANKGPSQKEIKKQKEEEAKKYAALFGATTAPVVQKKVPLGVDPKSIVCEFFKKGTCKKGGRCKFSHELETERKGPKIDLYTDQRDRREGEEGMEDWDEDTLRSVVNKKDVQRPNQTDIVCKYFIKAIEDKKYGWFWSCPNGDTCIYRHRLPPGFVLKSEKTKGDEGPVLSIEDIIESERAKLSGGTPVTLDSFNEWKVRSKARKEAKRKEEEASKKDKAANQRDKERFMSGKALFEYNPDIFVDDENAEVTGYTRQDSEDEDGDSDEEGAPAAAAAAAAAAPAGAAGAVVVDEGAFSADVEALDLNDDDL